VLPGDVKQQKHEYRTLDAGPISWWSWRPGIKPRSALIIGVLIALVALLLAGIGMVTLVLGILDSLSPPLQVAGVVINHAANSFDGQPHLTIRLHAAGFPGQVSPTVSPSASHAISNGDAILVDYSPRLHVLYALDGGGQHFLIPGSSVLGDAIGSTALLLLGTALLPYPALLFLWGWCDLYGRNQEHKRAEMTAQVLGLRATEQKRANRPGIVPHTSRSWYGVALRPAGKLSEQPIMTFAISREMYKSLRRGDLVRITYSSNLHYVYALEQAGE